mmetsp:Transcript_2321/g.5783  ORF Transcript_2321/g.5783 Transcript_2321/m.5783 type:complete len:243 (+) Transcript_2321:926-1654(+)
MRTTESKCTGRMNVANPRAAAAVEKGSIQTAESCIKGVITVLLAELKAQSVTKYAVKWTQPPTAAAMRRQMSWVTTTWLSSSSVPMPSMPTATATVSIETQPLINAFCSGVSRRLHVASSSASAPSAPATAASCCCCAFSAVATMATVGAAAARTCPGAGAAVDASTEGGVLTRRGRVARGPLVTSSPPTTLTTPPPLPHRPAPPRGLRRRPRTAVAVPLAPPPAPSAVVVGDGSGGEGGEG